MDKNILEIKTVQASAFRILIEALKEILTDANFECDESYRILLLRFMNESMNDDKVGTFWQE